MKRPPPAEHTQSIMRSVGGLCTAMLKCCSTALRCIKMALRPSVDT